jgi:hypothetical protein
LFGDDRVAPRSVYVVVTPVVDTSTNQMETSFTLPMSPVMVTWP